MGHFIDPGVICQAYYVLGHTVRVPTVPKLSVGGYWNSDFINVTWNKSTKRKEVAESYDFWTNGPDNTYLYSTKRFKNVQ